MLPLAGLTVIEIASFVAGPSAGLALAQLGADVVRVDPLGGAVDVNRWPVTDDGTSVYWSALNRAKRSVEIDLRSDTGQDLVRKMICGPGADRGVVIDNLPRAKWLDWPQLAALRSDVIHVHIEGHRDGRPAVDYTVNAEVGLPLVTGPEDAVAPINNPLPAWDLLCGMAAALAVVSAVHRRDRTGEGARVDISLSDIALATLANLGWYTEAATGIDRARHANSVYGSYGEQFTCSDGEHVMVVALTPSQWKALVSVTATSPQIADLEANAGVNFAENEAARFLHRQKLREVLDPWFASRPRAEVASALDEARVLWSPYRTMRDVAASGGGPLHHLQQPRIGQVISAESPMRWRDATPIDRAASALGEDTLSTLEALTNLGPEELRLLVDGGVLGGDR
ncbi:MAG TPA: CoA transferase [Mycobacteriales bacterium]|nr:CoA transferase [Mycobacteriales bacterium]